MVLVKIRDSKRVLFRFILAATNAEHRATLEINGNNN